MHAGKKEIASPIGEFGLASTRGVECSGLTTCTGDLTMQGTSQFDWRVALRGISFSGLQAHITKEQGAVKATAAGRIAGFSGDLMLEEIAGFSGDLRSINPSLPPKRAFT